MYRINFLLHVIARIEDDSFDLLGTVRLTPPFPIIAGNRGKCTYLDQQSRQQKRKGGMATLPLVTCLRAASLPTGRLAITIRSCNFGTIPNIKKNNILGGNNAQI